MANTNFIPFNQTPAFHNMQMPPKCSQPSVAQDPVLEDVLMHLETEPVSAPVIAPSVDIPALREQLAILVSTGRCKEAIGTGLTHEQVRRLDEKEVIKYSKRYEAHVGAKTTETLIESLLCFTTKALNLAVGIKDPDALKEELKNDYIINKELSQLSGSLALRCGRTLAVANGLLITAKHVDFDQFTKQNAEQYPAITEELPSNGKELLN